MKHSWKLSHHQNMSGSKGNKQSGGWRVLLAQPASWHDTLEVRHSQPDESQDAEGNCSSTESFRNSRRFSGIKGTIPCSLREKEEVYLEEKVMKPNYGGRTPVASVARDNPRRDKQMPQ